MKNFYISPLIDSAPEHEVMPPQRTSKVATAPPSAPPMEVPAPVGISFMC
ncbi:MAG: hypothetical protein KF872_06470 [Chitinophagales bacterium]|nr:hypothetical protein [Chitinophagales bacterium]